MLLTKIKHDHTKLLLPFHQTKQSAIKCYKNLIFLPMEVMSVIDVLIMECKM